jgi:ATP-dependent exoDNAse (exonuclease V) beta subunit
MTPNPREPLQRRIYRELAGALTTRLEGQALSWPVFLTAQRRMQARVRLTIARRLGVDDTHPSLAEALLALAEEAPEQAARDEALVRRWCQAHGIAGEAAGARAHVAARLEAMARREQAAHALDDVGP